MPISRPLQKGIRHPVLMRWCPGSCLRELWVWRQGRAPVSRRFRHANVRPRPSSAHCLACGPRARARRHARFAHVYAHTRGTKAQYFVRGEERMQDEPRCRPCACSLGSTLKYGGGGEGRARNVPAYRKRYCGNSYCGNGAYQTKGVPRWEHAHAPRVRPAMAPAMQIAPPKTWRSGGMLSTANTIDPTSSPPTLRPCISRSTQSRTGASGPMSS